MNAMLQQNRVRYQRQLLQGVLQDLDHARRTFMSYRSQVSSGYDAQEMHYVMLSMNEALKQIYTMQEEAQYLLEQVCFVERSLG